LAHGDLSLENVLLADADSTPEDARVKLIDFGASTGGRAIGTRGKPSYQAPEMHTGKEYDARVADIFSLGVMVFALMVGDYPWQSTRPHVCAKFTYYSQKGMALYLGRRKVENSNGEIQPLSQVLSPEVIILLEGLLTVDPQKRLTLPAALQLPWFQQIPASSATRSGSSATSPPPDPAPGSSSEQPPVAAEADESAAPSGNAT
jgi:serine/threonine protein kinase